MRELTRELFAIYDINAIRQIAEGCAAHKRLLEREPKPDREAIDVLRELAVAATGFVALANDLKGGV